MSSNCCCPCSNSVSQYRSARSKNLDQEFESICKQIQQSGIVKHDDAMTLFGLYKQSKYGDYNPSKSNKNVQYAWQHAQIAAWQFYRGTSQQDAKSMYIEKAQNVLSSQ